jgi:hypothetical protein
MQLLMKQLHTTELQYLIFRERDLIMQINQPYFLLQIYNFLTVSFFFIVLGFELSASQLVGRCSPLELLCQPLKVSFLKTRE